MPAPQPSLIALRRPTRGRMVAGVAAGIADELQIDPTLVRVALVILSFASGLGLVVYGLGFILIPDDSGADPVWRSVLVSRTGGEMPAVAARIAQHLPGTEQSPAPPVDAGQLTMSQPRSTGSGPDVLRGLAFGTIVVGVVLLIRALGLWFPFWLIWPLGLTAAGVSMGWRGPSAVGDGSWTSKSTLRVVAGGLLVLLGAATLIASTGDYRVLRQGMSAAVVMVAGLALIVAPWLVQLTADLGSERRARIRNEERAVLAAHLHDSVLQTLAIIQKRAYEPREVVTLARRQERELRSWLYGAANTSGTPTTFAAAIATAADAVEADHGVRVEVVQVGDVVFDERVEAIVAAAREAMVNAAKHAQVEEVSVYAEAGDCEAGRCTLEVFVRDRGVGFDPSDISPDRRGIADSIRSRLARVGGTVEITSAEGEGTEVHLEAQVRSTTTSEEAPIADAPAPPPIAGPAPSCPDHALTSPPPVEAPAQTLGA